MNYNTLYSLRSPTATVIKSILVGILIFALYPFSSQAKAETNVIELDNASFIQLLQAVTPRDSKADKIREALMDIITRAPESVWGVEVSDSGNSGLFTALGALENILRLDTAGGQIYEPGLLTNYSSPLNGDPNLSGICVIIGAANSVWNTLKLGNKKDATDSKGNFEKEFLKKIKNATSNPSQWGVSTEEYSTVYSAIAGEKITCETSLLKGPKDINRWKKQLLSDLAKGYDCSLSIRKTGIFDPNNGTIEMAWGHNWKVNSGHNAGDGKVSLNLLETGRQGDGNGHNVQAEGRSTQRLSIKPNTFKPGEFSIHMFKGIDRHLWNHFLKNQLNDEVEATCCYPNSKQDSANFN